MQTNEALAQLCAHFGIATRYQDVWGEPHAVETEDLIALLREFDVYVDATEPPAGSTTPTLPTAPDVPGPPEDDLASQPGGATVSAASALESLQREAWQAALPPVLAIGAGQRAWCVRVRSGLPVAAGPLRWYIETEDGQRHEGELDLSSCEETARCSLDGASWTEREASIAQPLPAGYHRFSLHGVPGEMLVICAPDTCYRPPALSAGGRIWGPAVQLYGLRSSRNWGVGDFSDLARLGAQMAERGAHLVGLNPMHALFPHNPAHASPYSPSSRQRLNVLYIDPEAVDHYATCPVARERVNTPDFQDRLAALRSAELVDYTEVAALKLEVLRLLFRHFVAHHLAADGAARQSRSATAYRRFVASEGEGLRRHAIFEAMQAHRHAPEATSPGGDRPPEAWPDADSATLREWADAHDDEVQFYQYLQWLAHTQLQQAAAVCRASGMVVGLYLDLAVSIDRSGSDAWRERRSFARKAGIGAPPDAFNPNGQNWGLLPPRPDRLRASGYRYFIETLRANMRGVGALRIDHVMGLMRLYWIPGGRGPDHGAYVHYAAAELLAIVALESQRNRCMVIGEDLGTVDESMREALTRYGVLSYRLFYFEQEAAQATPQHGASFKTPEAYPEAALVAISTHDLATLQGWWRSEDLRTRWELGLYPAAEVFEQQLRDRAHERVALLLSLRRAGLLTLEEVGRAAGSATLEAGTVAAAHAYLARTPSVVMLAQLEDLLGVVDQPNMPGTTTEQPNWRRKLPTDLAAMGADQTVAKIASAINAERALVPVVKT